MELRLGYQASAEQFGHAPFSVAWMSVVGARPDKLLPAVAEGALLEKDLRPRLRQLA